MSRAEQTDRNFEGQKGVSVGVALLLSLLFHFAFATTLHLFDSIQPKASQAIEIEMISEAPEAETTKPSIVTEEIRRERVQLEQQVVDQDDQQVNDEVDENTRFLGKHNQKVLRQTRAQEHGAFQNIRENKAPPPLKWQSMTASNGFNHLSALPMRFWSARPANAPLRNLYLQRATPFT